MPIHRDRAICLRKFEYSETSQILTLLFRSHGLIRVIAKGAHRRTRDGASKFDGGADLLDVGDCVFVERQGKDLSTLTEWKLIDGHLDLRNSLRSAVFAQIIAEVITSLFPEHEPFPWIYGRLRATLPHLGLPDRGTHFAALLLDTVRLAGYLPSFRQCADCRQTHDRTETSGFLSRSVGGILCRACAMRVSDRRPAPPGLVDTVERLALFPRERGLLIIPPRTEQDERNTADVSNLMLTLIEQVTQRMLRSLNFARQTNAT